LLFLQGMPVPEFSALSTSLMAGEWRLKCSRCGAEAWLTILPRSDVRNGWKADVSGPAQAAGRCFRDSPSARG